MFKVREEAYQYYFYFVQERMKIFWKRYRQGLYPFSNDPILSTYKFTNVYRATDRVSQYLIKEVIYREEKYANAEDVLLNILLFKIFNKIETWELIQKEYGRITVATFRPTELSLYLSSVIKDTPIFSSAYMMTGTHGDYNHLKSKHEKWLSMVEMEFVKRRKFDKIIKAKSLNEVYDTLNSCAFLGGFLSYQYAIDFNYSEVIDFDENSFVKAGIGAIRGVKKCFNLTGKYNCDDIIRYTYNNFEKYQQKYGYTDFESLFGRNPTLIDIQNCFCETDKYLRVKMPELQVDNVRIKHKFKKPIDNPKLFLPPKWGLNVKINNSCLQQNIKELTLF